MGDSVIRIRSVASPLHDPEAIADLRDRLGLPGLHVDSGPAEAVLVLTGGSEAAALRALDESGARVLVAHDLHNALPAALEVSARLHQEGRSHRLVLDPRELARIAPLLTANASLRGLRLGRIGAPSEWLVASAPSPDVVRRAWGVEVVDVPLEELAWEHAPEEGGRLMAGADEVVEPSEAEVFEAAGLQGGLEHLVARHRLDAFTLRCFDLVVQRHTTACVAVSHLLDGGLVAGCEGDVPAALTMMWMAAHTGLVPFMANPQGVDLARGELVLAHCAAAPGLLDRVVLRSHFESGVGVGVGGTMAPGPACVARLGGAELDQLQVWDGQILPTELVEGRCRTQVRVRVEGDLRELVERPLGNHLVLVQGHAAERLCEAHALQHARRV